MIPQAHPENDGVSLALQILPFQLSIFRITFRSQRNAMGSDFSRLPPIHNERVDCLDPNTTYTLVNLACPRRARGLRECPMMQREYTRAHWFCVASIIAWTIPPTKIIELLPHAVMVLILADPRGVDENRRQESGAGPVERR